VILEMPATLKAIFDGKQFLPEKAPSLEPGRTYLLHVEEVEADSRAAKIAALRQAMTDEIFLQDIHDVTTDFSAVDAED
jgi:hypothetical protein